MAKGDWFRNTEWSRKTQSAFWERWGRSRSDFHRAQYLRIQGVCLTSSNNNKTIRAGVELLEQVVREFPNESTQLAMAHVCMGDALVALGDDAAAIAAYRAAIEAERRLPSVDAGARFRFALLATARAESSLYQEALGYLDSPPSTGPSLLINCCFIDCAARAIIHAERGARDEARRLAKARTQAGRRAIPARRSDAGSGPSACGLRVPSLGSRVDGPRPGHRVLRG